MNAIASLAAELRREHGTADPFRICEERGIAVFPSDLPAGIKGFYFEQGSSQMIFLNQELEEREARVVCAHELGHALLHEECNTLFLQTATLLNCRRYENEADTFCACLLLGDEARGEGDEPLTVEDIARRAGLPGRLVDLWLHACGD